MENEYIAPSVEIIEVEVEAGFALSEGDGYPTLPDA